MNIFKVVLMVTDFDGLGENNLRTILENNRNLAGAVHSVEMRTVEWSDSHPLNHGMQWQDHFAAMFMKPMVFANRGEQPEDSSELDCITCGGSGHRDDTNAEVDRQIAIVDAMRHQRLERRLQNLPVENERRHGFDRRARSDNLKD